MHSNRSHALTCLLLIGATFSAAQQTVITLDPDSITQTSAYLRGRCYPNGQALTYQFEWGITRLLTIGLGLQNIPPGASVTDVGVHLGGLAPNTTYMFQLYCLGGCTPGEYRTFTPLPDSTAGGFVIPLRLRDSTGATIAYDVHFGVHTHATYCVDRGLGEYEIPPIPPVGVPDLRLQDTRTGAGRCMDQGVQIDIRPYYWSTQIDTYKVRYQAGQFGAVLSWPDLSAHYLGSIRMIGPNLNIDMKAQSSVTFEDESGTVRIIAEGPTQLLRATFDGVTTNDASVRATFSPGGYDTYGWVEWGQTTSYGQTTPSVNLGNGQDPATFTRTISGLQPDVMYHFRAVTQNAVGIFYGVNQTFHTSITTSLEADDGIPSSFALQQNYPNPFNPVTTIQYSIPRNGQVRLIVYDVFGRQVDVLESGVKSAGNYKVNFDASRLASGVYMYRLQADGFSIVRKMLVVK
jgi:hypothetical protein